MGSKSSDFPVASGKGPTIVVQVEGGNSEWDPRTPDIIYLSENLLDATQKSLENARKTGDGTDLMTNMFETSVAVLHESSHKMADQLGVKDQESSTAFIQYERGLSFESLAFGKNSTTSVSRSTGITIRDSDKMKKVAFKAYGTPKGFGMTISGYLNNTIDASKLKIPMSTNSTQ